MINGAVYDPTTTRTATCTDGSSQTVRDPFPNNFIGAPSTWDFVAQKVLSYLPSPSGSTADQLTNNYPNLQPNNKYQYLTSIQLDHYIGEKWHLMGYYIAEYSDKDNATDGINGVAAQTRWNTTPAPQAYFNADYTATPNLVLHAGFDFTRHAAMQNSAVQNFHASTLGLNTAANMPGGAANTFPVFNGLTVNRQGVPQMGIKTLRSLTTTGMTLNRSPGSMDGITSYLAAISVIRCLALTTTSPPDFMASTPLRPLCRLPKGKTSMAPPSAMVSQASFLAS